MNHDAPAEDFTAALLERRWFAVERAAAEVRAKCDMLAYVRERADLDWRDACVQLRRLESLSDALSEQLSVDPCDIAAMRPERTAA